MNRSLSVALAALGVASIATPVFAQPLPDQPWSAEGRIEDGDSRNADNARYDEHRFRLEAGRRYRISAESADFDTLIELVQTGETEPVAVNDDSAGTLNSRITYTPEETAEYMLRVLSFAPEGRGAYTARAELLPPLAPPVSDNPDDSATLRWHIWNGELTGSDPERDGAHFDDYLIRAEAGETRLILADSSAFDTMIWILSADGREGEPVVIDDDSGTGFNAMIAFRPEDPGDYLVRVTSYGSNQTGAYRLRISEPITPPLQSPPMPDEASHDHH